MATVNMSGGSSNGGKVENNPGYFKFDGRRSYVLETLDEENRERIDKLRKIQRDLDVIKAGFHNERANLEASFLESCEPLYLQRYNIVNGVVEEAGITTNAAARATSMNQTKKQKEGEGVPSFWLYALKGCDDVYDEIKEQDEGALKHLTDIKWSKIQKGFRLEFHFSTNPFFENPVLTKTYHMTDEDGFFIECAIGTEIKWRPGKCLTHKLAKESGKGSKKVEPMTIESFFGFFSPPNIPKNLKDEKNLVEVINQKYDMEMDFCLGLTIRDQIIPCAVTQFTGKAALEDKTKISAQHSNFLDNLGKNARKCVESLRLIQEKLDALTAEFDENTASVQAKYLQSCEHLYLQRHNIVNDPEADGVGSDYEDEAYIYGKGVPYFWLNALQNNDYIENEITYRDEQALKYLKDIKSSPIDDSEGFKLDFCFKANPFFENSVLTKTFLMSVENDISLVKDIKGTEIEWYPARCLTTIPIKKKPETQSEDAKSITVTEDCDSFFSLFGALEVVDDNFKRSRQAEHDFHIGLIIRDQIIPHAVSWFTGEAIENRDDLQDDEDQDQYLGFEAEYYDDNEDGDDEYEDLDHGLGSDGDDSDEEYIDNYNRTYNYY
uniref:nucleosome assembly protein 1;2-like isoform X2 n=1 Tax=Fragaria vesca subsp. vesca TaxID=101020 RepID=UPI0005CB5A16|nr:PREDICTED: nucleosome assembly protein 1;2-like isoform X2 [Fragaria vesca subsp. vesca]